MTERTASFPLSVSRFPNSVICRELSVVRYPSESAAGGGQLIGPRYQTESAISCGDVVHASGPWRTTGRWWSDTARYALDHFDVQVSDGTVLRLCFDWYERSWRVDGVYD